MVSWKSRFGAVLFERMKVTAYLANHACIGLIQGTLPVKIGLDESSQMEGDM
jgi:hypothetical protein